LISNVSVSIEKQTIILLSLSNGCQQAEIAVGHDEII